MTSTKWWVLCLICTALHLWPVHSAYHSGFWHYFRNCYRPPCFHAYNRFSVGYLRPGCYVCLCVALIKRLMYGPEWLVQSSHRLHTARRRQRLRFITSSHHTVQTGLALCSLARRYSQTSPLCFSGKTEALSVF